MFYADYPKIDFKELASHNQQLLDEILTYQIVDDVNSVLFHNVMEKAFL